MRCKRRTRGTLQLPLLGACLQSGSVRDSKLGKRASWFATNATRRVVEIVGFVHLFRRSQIFLAEMPGNAPTYKRECNVRRKQTSGIRRIPGDVTVRPRLGVTRSGTWVDSTASPVTGFSPLCRLRDQSYVVGSTQHSPVTALMRRFARTSRRRCLRTTPRECALNIGKARPSLISRGDHDHERIRGAVSAPSAITVSNLRGGPGIQSGRKAEFDACGLLLPYSV